MIIMPTVAKADMSADNAMSADLGTIITTPTPTTVTGTTVSVNNEIVQTATTISAPTPAQVGTSAALSGVINALVVGTIDANLNPGSENFCNALNQTLMNQSDNARASLAWNADSYAKNIGLRLEGKNEAQVALHGKALQSYKEGSGLLKNLTPKSTKEADQVMLSRFQAVARSSFVEMTVALKAKNPDTERIEKLSRLLDGSLECAYAYSADTDTNKNTITSIKTSLGGLVTSWDDTKSSFGIESTADTKNDFNFDVEAGDVTDEEIVSAPVSAGAVTTQEELKAYVGLLMKRDDHLRQVESDNDSIEVRYVVKGKFLGFIPVWVNATASVDTTGQVDIDYPWYKGLSSVKAKVDKDELTEGLTKARLIVKNDDGTQKTSEAASEMSMKYRAAALDALVGFMKAKLDTSISADVKTEVNDVPDVEIETSQS